MQLLCVISQQSFSFWRTSSPDPLPGSAPGPPRPSTGVHPWTHTGGLPFPKIPSLLLCPPNNPVSSTPLFVAFFNLFSFGITLSWFPTAYNLTVLSSKVTAEHWEKIIYCKSTGSINVLPRGLLLFDSGWRQLTDNTAITSIWISIYKTSKYFFIVINTCTKKSTSHSRHDFLVYQKIADLLKANKNGVILLKYWCFEIVQYYQERVNCMHVFSYWVTSNRTLTTTACKLELLCNWTPVPLQ